VSTWNIGARQINLYSLNYKSITRYSVRPYSPIQVMGLYGAITSSIVYSVPCMGPCGFYITVLLPAIEVNSLCIKQKLWFSSVELSLCKIHRLVFCVPTQQYMWFYERNSLNAPLEERGTLIIRFGKEVVLAENGRECGLILLSIIESRKVWIAKPIVNSRCNVDLTECSKEQGKPGLVSFARGNCVILTRILRRFHSQF